MEENFKNKLGLTFFILVIVFLLVGGFIYTNHILNPTNKNEESKKEVNYKIDKDNPYIYYKNEEVISESAEIYYKDVVINLNTQQDLNSILDSENERYKSNIKYLSDASLLSDDLINYKNDNLYMLTYREYENYEYENYVSLVLNDFNYSCFDNSTFIGTKSYIFDTSNGKQLTEDEILALYDVSMEEIKNKIRNVLDEKQTTNEEGNPLLKIDETLNEFTQYALYINEYGRLYITYLVKTSDVDYNEIMEVK